MRTLLVSVSQVAAVLLLLVGSSNSGNEASATASRLGRPPAQPAREGLTVDGPKAQPPRPQQLIREEPGVIVLRAKYYRVPVCFFHQNGVGCGTADEFEVSEVLSGSFEPEA